MHLRLIALTVATAVSLLPASLASAQPQQQRLVQPGNLTYLGKFTVPHTDGSNRGTAEGSLLYGGYAIGLGPDGQSLYFGCHDWGSRLARVTIPALGSQAKVVETCAPMANLAGINPGDPNSKKLGGSLWWNGRLLVSAYSYYDGNGTASASHFTGTTVANQVGPYRVGTQNPGLTAGYMGVIPQEWRTLLGGPALTGQCCLAVITRSSFGPSVSAFNPDDVGKSATTPATMLVGYPDKHQTFGPWNVQNPYYTGVTVVGGLAFPGGTRSVLFIGRHGTTFCYGSGTSNASLAGKPDGQGNIYCYDPVDGSKGSHGYPYKHQIWAYDANDLLAVKQGTKQPWDVLPYGVWPLTDMDNSSGGASMRSAAYDPATGRWYVTVDSSANTPVVHVYQVNNAVVQPPAPGPLGFAVQIAGTTATLSWSPPVASSYTLTGYSLEGGTTPGGVDSGVVALPTSARSYQLQAGLTGTFYFRLLAKYSGGASGASPELKVTLNGGGGGGGGKIPAPPTNVRATPSAPNLLLNWDSPADDTVTNVVADIGTASGTSNLVTGAALGKFGPYVLANAPTGTYYIRLRAINPTGSSAPSNEVKVTMGGTGGDGIGVPPAPKSLQASVTWGRRVNLSWREDPNGPDTVGYRVEVGSRPGGVEFGSIAVTTQSTTAGPVAPGTYYIRVRATNSHGAGAPSNEVRVVVR